MTFGIDCYSPVTDAVALKAAGAQFACRYVSTPGNPKNITVTEAARLKAAGVNVVIVFENTKGRALSGRIGGQADATLALQQAVAAGMPDGCPIYFAVDFDATSTQQPAVNAYLNGAVSVLGKSGVGVYGSYRVVKAVLDAGICKWAWQTYAWSSGVWDTRAHIQQYSNGQVLAGHSVDFNHATVSDYGQWKNRTLIPLPARRIITAGDGTVLARTRHPILWQRLHPNYKGHSQITIRRLR
jgi:hypothetical protein